MKRQYSRSASRIALILSWFALAVTFTGIMPAQSKHKKPPQIAIVPVNPEGTPTGFGVVTGNNISYNGGPVMVSPHNVYFIWYGNWNSNTATTILPAFITGLNHSLYFNTNISYAQLVVDPAGTGHILSEANIANTVTMAGQIFDSYSQGTSLSVTQVQNVVTRGLSHGLPTDANGIYFVLTSADVTATSGAQSFCNNFCGYHTYNPSNLLKFAFVGNSARCINSCAASNIGIGPNGNAGADGMANVIAHELNETITDPLLNAWFAGSTLGEVGDLCNFNFGTNEFSAPNGAPANVVLGSRDFLIQQNFVNSSVGGGCQLSYGANGTKSSATVAITGAIACDPGGGCDEGTVSLSVNTTTESVFYDGFGINGAGSVQAIATNLASMFNSDPNSPVTATVVQGPTLPAGNGDNWQILLQSKTAGASVNYGLSGSVSSLFGISSNLAVTSHFLMTGGSGPCCQ